MKTYFVGVDLGKRRDSTALVVVERQPRVMRGMDWINYGSRVAEMGPLLTVRWVERVRLGTSYGAVVRRVAEMVRKLAGMGPCVVVVDATGLGEPVVDLLREAGMGCEIVAVTITGGDAMRRVAGGYHVPKKDLMGGLQVGIEEGRLRVSAGLTEWPRLVEEMMAVRQIVAVGGGIRYEATGQQHDDLVLAMALAYWRAGRGDVGERGERLL